MLLTRHHWMGTYMALAGSVIMPGGVFAADECASLSGEMMTIIVPYSVGGSNDAYMRALAPQLAELSGGEVQVKNVVAAGGLVGIKAILGSKPDGRIIGIVNTTELLMGHLIDGDKTPSLLDEFTQIGQIALSTTIWLAAANSDIKNADDLAGRSKSQPLTFAMRAATGNDLIGVAVLSDVADVPFKIVTGYRSGGDEILAVMRGEVDMIGQTFETARPQIEAGDLRPILQLASTPHQDALLKDTPTVAGPDGWLVRRAVEQGKSREEALRLSEDLVAIVSQPRAVVAPAGLEPGMTECLRQLFMSAVTAPGFADAMTAAHRTTQVLPGAELDLKLRAMEESARRFVPIIQDARRRAGA